MKKHKFEGWDWTEMAEALGIPLGDHSVPLRAEEEHLRLITEALWRTHQWDKDKGGMWT